MENIYRHTYNKANFFIGPIGMGSNKGITHGKMEFRVPTAQSGPILIGLMSFN